MKFKQWKGRPRLAAYVEINSTLEADVAAQFGAVQRVDSYTLSLSDGTIFKNLFGFLEVTTIDNTVTYYTTDPENNRYSPK